MARIPSWASASSLVVAPLSGGITNRNYRVDVDGEAFVLRIWSPAAALLGIDRRREYRCAVAASQAGAGPEVVWFLPEDGIMVTRFVAGRCLSPGEAAPPQVVERVVRAIRRCHTGPAFDGSLSPFRTIEEYLDVARRHGAPLPEDIAELSRPLPAIEAALGRDRSPARPCHNDLWGPNLIDDGVRVWIVDWEYAGMGDVYFDLANFAMHHAPSDALDEALLLAYSGEASDAAFARLKLLKIVAELREALWYLAALVLPTATADFTLRAATHFDRYRKATGDARLTSWLALVERRR